MLVTETRVYMTNSVRIAKKMAVTPAATAWAELLATTVMSKH